MGTPDLAEYYYVGKKWRFGIPTQRPIHSGGRVRTIRFSAVLRRHGSITLPLPFLQMGKLRLGAVMYLWP